MIIDQDRCRSPAILGHDSRRLAVSLLLLLRIDRLPILVSVHPQLDLGRFSRIWFTDLVFTDQNSYRPIFRIFLLCIRALLSPSSSSFSPLLLFGFGRRLNLGFVVRNNR